jgi:hypothetical protein
MRREVLPVVRGRIVSRIKIVWVVGALVLGAMLFWTGSAYTQAAPAQQATATPNARVFPNDAGMILNFIKPDKTGDFEEVMGKLKEALMKSDKPERKQQAAGWKIFKSPDPAQGGNVLYIFIIDPVLKGADYQVSNILVEGLGNNADTNALYKKYADSYATGMNIVNLQLLSDLGK